MYMLHIPYDLYIMNVLYYTWPEAELPRLRPEHQQNVLVLCGMWKLHGKKCDDDYLTAWLSATKT